MTAQGFCPTPTGVPAGARLRMTRGVATTAAVGDAGAGGRLRHFAGDGRSSS